MRSSTTILAFFGIFLGSGMSATPLENPKPTLDEVCAATACRPANTVKLRQDADHSVETNLEKAPYYYDGVLNIVAGEKLFIEAIEKEGKLVEVRRVEELTRPEVTLIFELKQIAQPSGKYSMLLTITNTYKKILKFKIFEHRAGTDNFRYTSSCPVLAGKANYESWPYPIVQLAISSFQLKEQAPTTCE